MKFLRIICVSLLFLSITSLLYSQQTPAASTSPQEEKLSVVQKQARLYREEGLKEQDAGNLDKAFTYYRKAVALDHSYALAYNDLGVLYEAGGDLVQAEENYLKAVALDANCLSAYSNLALLYENKRDPQSAIFYWKKRVELGDPLDPWTQKAKAHLREFSIYLGKKYEETEIIDLVAEASEYKAALREDDAELANLYFSKAKTSYRKGDYAAALRLAYSARRLDPANKKIENFIRKVQARL